MRSEGDGLLSISDGFSLIEMLVALAILGITLGILYQAAGGAARNVATGEKYAYGVELASSLLSLHQLVPANGLVDSGETAGGFEWEVHASPVRNRSWNLPAGALQQIQVVVSWKDRGRVRSFELNSTVAGLEIPD